MKAAEYAENVFSDVIQNGLDRPKYPPWVEQRFSRGLGVAYYTGFRSSASTLRACFRSLITVHRSALIYNRGFRYNER